MKNKVISVLSKYTSASICDSTVMDEIGLSSFDMFCIISELEEDKMYINYDRLAAVKTVQEFVEAIYEE